MADEKDLTAETADGEFDEVEIVELDGEQFEAIYSLEHEDTVYVALIPYTDNEDDSGDEEETEFIIMKEVEEDGEYFLATVDEDDLYDELGELFLKEFEAINNE